MIELHEHQNSSNGGIADPYLTTLENGSNVGITDHI